MRTMPSSPSSSLPLSATLMDSSSSSSSSSFNNNPLASFSSFLNHHFSRLASDLSSRVAAASRRPPPFASASLPPLSSSSASLPPLSSSSAFDLALSAGHVAKTMSGTSVFTVSNSMNEFVLVSDPNNGAKSLGVLCFRHEDAQALLAQVKLRQPVLGKGARVVPITLEQVYMLKVEGIAFRFLPDPIQIKNALQLKAADISQGFDGVPVFQEDIERELSMVARASRGPVPSPNIMVGSLEDVLKKMELQINNKNSGWEDLVFIPPGKSYVQHINEVASA